MTTSADLLSLLRLRFPAAEYALFTELRNGTGWSRKARSADAVAMSLWPSRGLDLHGFEIKIDRKDLVRELKNPEKADEIAGYCDFWWLVLSDVDIIPSGLKLPRTWGVLVPDANGKLAVHVEATKLKAKKLDRSMFASIFRNAQTAMERRLAGWVRPEVVDERVRERVEMELLPLKSENERLVERSAQLHEEQNARREEALLFGLQMWASPAERARVANVVRQLCSRQQVDLSQRLQREIRDLESVLADLKRATSALDELGPISRGGP